jgi:subtilisin-like proprotein convertase family protein
MKQKLLFVVLTTGFAISGNALTNTFTVLPSPAVAIPDNAYNGTLGSMASVPLLIPIRGAIQDVNVTLGITHSWIGDLTIKLQSPAGTIVTLLSRPGWLEPADDGSDGGNGADSSDLSASFLITYDDSQATSAETMGSLLAATGVVCQNDSVCAYAPNSGAASSGTLSLFNGQNASGTWTLYVGDAGDGDSGTISQFSLTVVTPDPPKLQISTVGKNIVVSWPTNSSGFSLEANQSLQPNGWGSPGGALSVSGSNFTVSLPATNTAKFFRLRKP